MKHTFLILTLFLSTSIFANNIKNPYKFIWNEKNGKKEGIQRFFLDINGDKKDELFVAANFKQNKNGLHGFWVFQKLENEDYLNLGYLNINPQAFVLSKQLDKNGFNVITSFWPLSNREKGTIAEVNYTKDGFQISKTYGAIKQDQFIKKYNAKSIQVKRSGLDLRWKP